MAYFLMCTAKGFPYKLLQRRAILFVALEPLSFLLLGSDEDVDSSTSSLFGHHWSLLWQLYADTQQHKYYSLLFKGP